MPDLCDVASYCYKYNMGLDIPEVKKGAWNQTHELLSPNFLVNSTGR